MVRSLIIVSRTVDLELTISLIAAADDKGVVNNIADNNRSTIVGPPLGNTVSFINHACHPNAEAQKARGKIKTVPTRRVLLRSTGTRILSVPGSGA